MKKSVLTFVALLVVCALIPEASHAIPLFARRYKIPCSACHTAEFKLNDFGGLFDVNGYELPGTIESTPIWQAATPPFSIVLQGRGAFQQSHDDVTGVTSSKRAFNGLTALVLFGGALAPHVSCYGEYDVENNGTELVQGLEYAYINFNNLTGGATGDCNIRMGKDRPETPIEQVPELYASPYLIYTYPLLISSRPRLFQLQSPMYGASLYGKWAEFPGAPFYDVALYAGDVSDVDFSAAKLFYARLAPSFSVGSVPVSIGVTAIAGGQTSDPLLGTPLSNSVFHWGVDWQISDPWGGAYTIYGQVMRFHSSDVYTTPGSQPQDALGGYVELNDVVVPETFTLMLRYDFLDVQTALPAYTQTVNTNQLSLIAKYFFLPNTFVFFEGNYSGVQTAAPATNTVGTVYLSGGFFYGI